ncbi:hypothetical protein ALC62_15567 [Cyphomyrmex costatus]|uniref:Uncharacterized protein n=1 Tax=Cyphomyrmex costatus TaxID=456900 RepID=A0A195BZU6_9HYME|nr:hypothetical protein ALC62_15567 [Cyphomyrmex costatus]
MFRQRADEEDDRLEQPRGKFHVGIGSSQRRRCLRRQPHCGNLIGLLLDTIHQARVSCHNRQDEFSRNGAVVVPRENCTATRSIVLDVSRPCHQTSYQSSARSDYEIRSHDLRQRRFRSVGCYLRRATDLTSTYRIRAHVLSMSGDKIQMDLS